MRLLLHTCRRRGIIAVSGGDLAPVGANASEIFRRLVIATVTTSLFAAFAFLILREGLVFPCELNHPQFPVGKFVFLQYAWGRAQDQLEMRANHVFHHVRNVQCLCWKQFDASGRIIDLRQIAVIATFVSIILAGRGIL